MITIFISRKLEQNSIFQHTLSRKGVRVIGQSLIQFSPIRFEVLPKTNWIFFYSKKAIRFFFENLKTIPNPALSPTLRFATIGKASAALLQTYVQTVHFVGNGEPKATAAAFLKVSVGQKVLFPRAKNSRQSIQFLLGDAIQNIDLIIYKNEKRTNFDLPNANILVFTSPLNVEAYFSKYQLSNRQKVIAIGNTTALQLRALGITQVLVADMPNEKGLAEAVGRYLF